jgi:hypothetical protein
VTDQEVPMAQDAVALIKADHRKVERQLDGG